jgi:hypothetical protein
MPLGAFLLSSTAYCCAFPLSSLGTFLLSSLGTFLLSSTAYYCAFLLSSLGTFLLSSLGTFLLSSIGTFVLSSPRRLLGEGAAVSRRQL